MFEIGDTVKISTDAHSVTIFAGRTATVVDIVDSGVYLLAPTRANRHVQVPERWLESATAEDRPDFRAGAPCLRCAGRGNQGVYEDRVGAVVCNYCGVTQFKYAAVTFAALEEGDRFCSATEADDEAKVFIKGAPPAPNRFGHPWGANAYQEDAPDLHAHFGPGARVVLA